MLRKAAIGILVAMLVLLFGPALEAGPAAAVKIGEVTSYTGDVLVRTKGTWSKLREVPRPVFSTDKIVTRRGRAEMHFVDGGLLRVNVDSSVSITQQKKTVGFFMKRSVTVRQINVLVGDVYFNVKVEKGSARSYSVRSPSMTAAIRGSETRVTVNPDYVTYYARISGDIEARGDYQPHFDPVAMSGEFMGVDAKRLPLATNRKGAKGFGFADTAFAAWARVRAVPALIAPPIKRGPRMFEGLRLWGMARLATAREVIFEAEGFKESSVIARAALERMEKSVAEIEEMLKYAEDLSGRASGVSGAAMKAFMAASDTAVYAANAEASRMNADMAVTLAVLGGEEAALDLAVAQAKKADEAADGVQEKLRTAMGLAEEAWAALEGRAEDLALAAEAFMLAAQIGNADAYAQSDAALQAASGDTYSFEAALRYALLTRSLSRTADIAAGNVLAAVRQGNRKAIQDALKALTEAGGVALELSREYMEEGTIAVSQDEIEEPGEDEILLQEEPLPGEITPRLEVPEGMPASPAL